MHVCQGTGRVCKMGSIISGFYVRACGKCLSGDARTPVRSECVIVREYTLLIKTKTEEKNEWIEQFVWTSRGIVLGDGNRAEF